MFSKKLFYLILLALLFNIMNAQTGVQSVRIQSAKTKSPSAALPQYKPTRDEMLNRYRQTALLDSVIRNKVFKTNIQANWQAGGESFWYRNTLKDSVFEYFYVDAEKGQKQKAFDHVRLAQAVEKAAGKRYNASRLRISNMIFENNASQISFQMDGQWWKCNLTTYDCTATTAPKGFRENSDTARRTGLGNRGNFNQNELGPVTRRGRAFRSDSISPDKRWIAYIRNGNVFVRSADSAQQIQFTTEGSLEKPYGQLSWSPDSKNVVGYHINPVKEKEVYYVLSSASGTRGQLRSRGYAQPGDENTSYEMFVFNVADKKQMRVDIDVIDFSGPPYLNWRKDNNSYFTFERVDRGHQRFRIIEVNATSGKSRELVDEKTNTFIFEQRIFTYYMPETHEILWVTEKDGWRHIYLVDELTGKEKLQVTKGEWVVREIDSIDQKKREIWFEASGMNPDEDPYFIHYYRIGFDGKNLLKLTEGNANHRASFSPNRKYFIDNYSRVDMAPVIELKRTEDGSKIMELEKADITAYLATGIKLPEPFHTKGRDGVTDIWGVVFRPRHFDPKKRYPIIEQIYAGPQGSFVPKNFSAYGETQSLAELGFIVVQIDGMGTYNRSKAFHDVCWKNLADAGFPDRILWMKALAAKYPYVDTTRVGVYGTSAGGQNSAGALLFHPEFYDAAVSACGCHDNRVDKQWWNEQWMGYPVGNHYDEQSNITNAYRLQGDLLLIVGEADENVPPESTYRVVDALIKAGKNFEFLAVPGMGHGDGGPYGRKKKRDFFVKSLLGVDPPKRNINEL
ncbi:MAG TPA: DPP IV N-terminal domain-containing protein [Chitinophagaceae bacterium]|jgi:dipeptidyl aminopeptidase/acylaminoacyl peptidase|nr:DPP IV N-terminal domain-containing protein [Chitinophagaceae bacterium]